jgi:spermidine synthase
MATRSDRCLIWLCVAALGVSAVVTQLVLLRELLAAFDGNEMVFGVILGNWLLLSGAGSVLGRVSWRSSDPIKARRQKKLPEPLWLMTWAQIVVAVAPLVAVVLLRFLRDLIFHHGVSVSWWGAMWASAAVLAPFCVASGYMLTMAVGVLTRQTEDPNDLLGVTPARIRLTPEDATEIGGVYVADGVGSVIGGAAFCCWILWSLDHVGALCAVAALNLVVAGVAAARRRWWGIVAAAAAVVVSLAGMPTADLWTTQWQYGPGQILFCGNSPYGRLVVTRTEKQLNFVQNGVPVFSSGNPERAEEIVHYAMAQRPAARRVLLIGGSATGAANEVLRYPEVGVTVVELDPMMVEATRRFAPDALSDKRIRVVMTDGRLFVRETQEKFDVVIVAMPAPSTTLLNRFYTAEFFADVKRTLAKDGVLSFALGRYENFVSLELGRMLGTAQQTMKTSFAHTLLLPVGRVTMLASDGELTTDIAARIAARGIKLKLVTGHYLDAMLTADRLAALRTAADKPKSSVNRDFEPVLYNQHLHHWMSRDASKTAILTALVVAATLACPLLFRVGAVALFAGGFAGTALEMVLLLAYQVMCGAMYQWLGVAITVFMAGLVIGGWIGNHQISWSRRWTLSALAALVAAFAGCLPIVLDWLPSVPLEMARWTIMALMFGLALLLGLEFPIAVQPERSEAKISASRMYGADFIGAAMGAFAACTVLIPLVGAAVTCWIVGGLNLASVALLWRRRK